MRHAHTPAVGDRPVVQTTTSIMRSGRFALLAGFVAVVAVTALAWARSRHAPTADLPSRVSAAAPPKSLTAPAEPALAAPPPTLTAGSARPQPAVDRPRTQASDERAAAARIDALVQAGDIGRARDFAEEFLRLYPSSSYCQHIETLTGVHPRPPIPGE
jgi:hypothetical protein